MTGGLRRIFNSSIGGVIFTYIPTSSTSGGRLHCGKFTSTIYGFSNTVGTCRRVHIDKSHLTVRRGFSDGSLRGMRIVRFSGSFFQNGGVLMFSSVLAGKFSCTHFTYRLRGVKNRILKNFFLNGAIIHVLWSREGERLCERTRKCL